MADTPRRIFRLRVRPGRAVIGAHLDGSKPESGDGAAGSELLLSEAQAAFLVRQRAVDILEVIETPVGDGPTGSTARGPVPGTAGSAE